MCLCGDCGHELLFHVCLRSTNPEFEHAFRLVKWGGFFFEWWKSLLVSHGVVGKGMVVETWTWNGELGYGQEGVFMDRKAWVEEA